LLPASVRKNLAVHVSLSSFLHNVKELTFTPHWQNVGGNQVPDFNQQNKLIIRLPGRSSALSDFAKLWEQLKVIRVVSAAVFKLVETNCQHRFFKNFSEADFLNHLSFELAFASAACFRLWRLAAPRSSAMSRVIGVAGLGVKPLHDKNDIFASAAGAAMWKTRLTCQRFQATQPFLLFRKASIRFGLACARVCV